MPPKTLSRNLPIHWMWWPAIGGLVVGLGGLIFPQALGVGYDTIGALLQGDVPRNDHRGILLVKSVIWAVSLGSGTSGGVLAPLLMMGGALGGLEAMFLPHEGAGFWPLVSMGAILGGTMRSPFTGIVFALELTHDVNMLLPLLVAVIDRARVHRADAEALDPDRESGAARLSSEPRIRRRSAGDSVRARSDANQRGGVSSRRPAVKMSALPSIRATSGAVSCCIPWWMRINGWLASLRVTIYTRSVSAALAGN